MVLYFGDKDISDYIEKLYPDISSDIASEEYDAVIISEYSLNAVSKIRNEIEKGIPVLGILEGFRTVVEAYGGECCTKDDCPEGKQEIAVLDTDVPIHKGLAHIMYICRGNANVPNEDKPMPGLYCIARSESGDIISLCDRNFKVYAMNFYINSSLTEQGDVIIKNFLNLI